MPTNFRERKVKSLGKYQKTRTVKRVSREWIGDWSHGLTS